MVNIELFLLHNNSMYYFFCPPEGETAIYSAIVRDTGLFFLYNNFYDPRPLNVYLTLTVYPEGTKIFGSLTIKSIV